jgi:hypothetical protein
MSLLMELLLHIPSVTSHDEDDKDEVDMKKER